MLLRNIVSAIKALIGGTPDKPAAAVAQSGPSASDKALIAEMLAGLAAQVGHERDLTAARGEEPVSVRLVPQVPVGPYDTAAGWFGGGARLPPGTAWPRIGGKPLQLLAQIECSRLPPSLWGGLGPRHGWLAVFIEPESLALEVRHFTAAGRFVPSPAIGEDCNIVGYDGRKRATASRGRWRLPRWPVDVVAVYNGKRDPRREGRSTLPHDRYGMRHDIVEDGYWPFDRPTVRMMLACAIRRVEQMIPKELPADLGAEALAQLEQNAAEAERAGVGSEQLFKLRASLDERRASAEVRAFAFRQGPAILDHLRALEARFAGAAEREALSPAAVAPVMAELQRMTWMHHGAPPFWRDGKELTAEQRYREGVRVFTLPFTTHPAVWHSPWWVHEFEQNLIEAAKIAYLHDPALLPPPLATACETLWRDLAAHEMGGMGHVPWGYVHEFDDRRDVTLIELASSQLIGWQFGDVDSLVVTVAKSDLARGNFSRPHIQISN